MLGVCSLQGKVYARGREVVEVESWVRVAIARGTLQRKQ